MLWLIRHYRTSKGISEITAVTLLWRKLKIRHILSNSSLQPILITCADHPTSQHWARSKMLTAVLMQTSVFWDTIARGLVCRYKHHNSEDSEIYFYAVTIYSTKSHYLQSNACFPNFLLMFEHFKLFWCIRSFSVIARTNNTALPWTARIEAVVAAIRLYTVATSWRCQLIVSILVSISTCEITLIQTVTSSSSHNCL